MKKIHYLCGLPRSGNTLFGSLMNQNPKISVTTNSIVCDIFCGVYTMKESERFKNYPDKQSFDNVFGNIMNNYYSHWKADYIIDRSSWGLPINFDILKKHYGKDIKIIVLVRDLKEILASFIKFSYSNNDNYIAKNAKTLDERCDFVMANNGELHRWINAVYNITRPENKEYIHLIEYNDLVNNTKAEIDKVYDYLDIQPFEHRFTNLSQLENNGIKYDDTIVGEGLHTVKEDKVEKSDYDMLKYLPSDVDKRYRLDKFW